MEDEELTRIWDCHRKWDLPELLRWIMPMLDYIGELEGRLFECGTAKEKPFVNKKEEVSGQESVT